MVLLKKKKKKKKKKDFKYDNRSPLYGNTPSSRPQKRLYGNMVRQKQQQQKNLWQYAEQLKLLYGNMLRQQKRL